MISYLRGEVIQAQDNPPRVVVLTASGVGYTVVLPAVVNETMRPTEGDSIGLHVYYSVTERQPLPLLVGFENAGDREFFEQFIQVEGIGPMRAATALTMPVPTLAYAIVDAGDRTAWRTKNRGDFEREGGRGGRAFAGDRSATYAGTGHSFRCGCSSGQSWLSRDRGSHDGGRCGAPRTRLGRRSARVATRHLPHYWCGCGPLTGAGR